MRVYKAGGGLYTKLTHTFIYFVATLYIEENMYKIKLLTHLIRLSDGHVMPDWIDCKDEAHAKEVRRAVDNREYDTDNHSIRIRRYPVSRHKIDVELWEADRFIGSPRGFW